MQPAAWIGIGLLSGTAFTGGPGVRRFFFGKKNSPELLALL
jgi:hypothetical protein